MNEESGMSSTEVTPRSRPITTISGYLHEHGYRFGSVLGEGSYSKVKLCTRYFEDGTPAYRLACKVISKTKASEDFVLKFLPRELDIVSKTEHPNIVRVFDIVEFDEQVYIFMDCCDKGDLLEYVKAKGQISESRTRHYYKQLASALEYLHGMDVAHRDLKCENILMSGRDQIRISDFGFSRYCRDKLGRRILSNTYCGSAAYAAPEILMGTNYNPKLYDMWSLGCVLFIMLTGHMPYDESDVPKMLKNQQDRVLVYPTGEHAVSPLAKTLVRRLLEPDVTRRANIEQAVSHEWAKIVTRRPPALSNGLQAGDLGRENKTPSRTRSAHGPQHVLPSGDHGRRVPKAVPGRFRLPEVTGTTSSPRTGQRGPRPVPAPRAPKEEVPARKASKSHGRYRSAMNGVTNLMHALAPAPRAGSRPKD